MKSSKRPDDSSELVPHKCPDDSSELVPNKCPSNKATNQPPANYKGSSIKAQPIKEETKKFVYQIPNKCPSNKTTNQLPANYKSSSIVVETIKEETEKFVYEIPTGYEDYVPNIIEEVDKGDYVEELEIRLDGMSNHTWESIDEVMKAIAKKHNISPKKLHDDFKSKNGLIPDKWVKRNDPVVKEDTRSPMEVLADTIASSSPKEKLNESVLVDNQRIHNLEKAMVGLRTIVSSTSGGGEVLFRGLDDVDLTTTPLVDGVSVIWSEDHQKWVAGGVVPDFVNLSTSNLSDIGNVDTTSIASGYSLIYDEPSDTWYAGVAGGPAGPTGDQGPQGIQGESGVNGTNGQGWTGGSYDPNTGVVTFTSTDGLGFVTNDLRGEEGETGPQGIQGIQGETGAAGPQGIQGEVGPAGSDSTVAGPTGPQGPQGEQGIQGIQGIQGETGDVGPQGIQGEVGPTGANSTVAGPTGPAGNDGLGFTGGTYNTATGQVTFTSDDGLGFTTSDLRGTTGDAGPQGIQGETGDTGPQGIQGDQGIQGIQGIQGETGDVGPQGIQGIQGETGTAGPQGIQGETGDTGPQGIQGIQGETGDTGPQGIQGIQGIQGETGDAGPQGIQGETGDAGPQGIQGEGVLSGGTTGQILSKASNTDFDTQWVSTPAADISSSSINQLNDVDTNSVSTGDLLKYNGTTWVTSQLDYSDLTGTPTIPTNNNELTNGSGYITDYTVTESDVTNHQAALSITESQISDLGSYLTSVNLNDITDVTITAASTGEVLRYNGTAWVDAQLAYTDISGTPTLGTSAATDSTDYATSAQGTLADSATQPSDLSTVATTGSYNDLSDQPTIPTVPVDSVNTQTGAVVLDADDIDDTLTTHKFVTAGQVTSIGTAVQPGDNVSTLTNDSGFITGYTVTSGDVTAHEGDITITESQISDLGTYATTASLATVATSGSYNDLTNKPTIPTNNNQLTNGAGYITDYTVTSGDVTAHEGDLTIAQSQVTNLTTDLAVKADLVGGVVPTSQIPSVAVTEYLGSVSSQGTLTALSGQQGDWAIRTDTGSTWVITTNDGSTFSDWVELATPSAPVTSVNGSTGTVVLSAVDVGAATTAQGTLADSATQPGDLATVATSGAYGDLTGTPTIPTNNNQLTNGSGYITDYTVTSGDVTAHEGDITITESQISDLGSYATTASLSTVATSGAYGDLTGTPTIPTNNNQLTNGSGYITTYVVTQGDVTAHQSALSITESQISDLGNYVVSGEVNPVLFSSQASFPSASTVHGAIAHSHSDGAMYFAHGGSWNKLANDSDVPTNNNQLTNGSGYITDITSENLSDLSDVTITSASSGEVLRYNGSIWVDAQLGYSDLSGTPTLGTAAATASTDYATSAQGTTADSAVQPGDLATVATSGSYNDLTNKPTIPTVPVDSVNTQTGAVVLDADDIDDTSTTHKFATSAQLTSIGTAVQPGDLSTVATTGSYNDLSNKPTIPTVPVDSVNTQTGAVVLDADDIDDTSTTHKFVTSAQVTSIGTAVQPGDLATVATSGAYGDLTGTPTIPTVPVDSVNTQTGAVVLDADDIDDTSTTHKFATSAQLTSIGTAVQPGDLATVATSGSYNDLTNKPTIPTVSVDSVNTQTGAVVLDADDIDDTSTTHKFATSAQLSAADSALQSGDNISTLTNDSGYITDYTVTQGDVTAHQSALSITESQISDLASYLTSTGSINTHTDVDTTTNAPTNGQVLEWNGSNWVPATVSGGGGASVTVSDTSPGSPSSGDLWWESDSGNLYIYYTDANTSQWVVAVKSGADGADGADGTAGTNGTNGTNGQGVPTGGSAGQVLSKVDGTDYNTQWITSSSSSPAYFCGTFTGSQSLGTNTFATLVYNATQTTSGVSDFTFASGEVTVVGSGTYQITYTAFARQTAGSNREEFRGVIQVNGSDVLGTRSSGYGRNSTQEGSSVAGTTIITLSASDVVRVQVSGDSTVTTAVEEGNITLFKIA